MLRVGLTGGIGSGKSTVAQMLRVLDVPVFEADLEARKLMEHDQELKRAISYRFKTTVDTSGSLDRKALAAVVFSDIEALKELNALVHPAVRRAFGEWASQQKSQYVVMEAAILTETGGHAAFDQMIVVSAPEELRIERVMRRDGVARSAVEARMKNQASEEVRLAIADHVIVNDDRQLVIPQVLELHSRLITAAG